MTSDEETKKLYQALCMGYRSEKQYEPPHKYWTTFPHLLNSHGLCEEHKKKYDVDLSRLEQKLQPPQNERNNKPTQNDQSS